MSEQKEKKEPLTYARALELGLWITNIVVGPFYASNAAVYQRAAVDMGDLLGHVRHYILVARYLKTITLRPDFYTEDQYRSSLFMACKRACFAHFRKYVRSLKRGIALRSGATIPIHEMQGDDDDGHFAQLGGGIMEGEEQYFSPVGHCTHDRVLAYLQYGGKLSKLRKVAPTIAGPHMEQFLRNRITSLTPHGT